MADFQSQPDFSRYLKVFLIFFFLRKWLPIKSKVFSVSISGQLSNCFGVRFVKLVLIGQIIQSGFMFSKLVIGSSEQDEFGQISNFQCQEEKGNVERRHLDIFKEEERLCLNVRDKVILIKSCKELPFLKQKLRFVLI